MRTVSLAAVAVLTVFGGPVLAQKNAKLFHNANHTSHALRQTASTTSGDTLYFVQPDRFRLGYGDTTGFRVALQDQDRSTAETVHLGFVKLAGSAPDPAKPVVDVSVSVFGTGSGAGAALFTVSLASSVPLPEVSALRSILPKLQSATDGIYVQAQRGNTLKTPGSVTLPQWTYYLDNQSKPAPFFEKGTTLYYGGLYKAPVLQVYTSSKAYQTTPENLFGPEALWPSSARQDGLGYAFTASDFPNQFAVIVLSGNRLTTPISTPFGPILIDPNGITPLPLPVPLNSQGSALTGTVPVPIAGLVLWAQGAALDFQKGLIATSDACQAETK